ncbi:Bestrophin, RFP-TM, chloride channel-domain-containing protein [Pisolithus albus]|nr:Bestrophin, RFP-TM, chloride channel-domain-containing protein [Pisolithus albus]
MATAQSEVPRQSADTFRTYHPTDSSGIQSHSASIVNTLLATAIFRCWHILLFFGGWSTMICLINQHVHKLVFQPTLLTVFGTVLGFIISYRTTSSFERYNEGRRLWSQIVFASRTFARTVWFHVPDNAMPNVRDLNDEERKSRTLIEKKTVINLLQAYAVAVKHYLRGEDGIRYVDLWPLVKFLPPYYLPATIPSHVDLPAELGTVAEDQGGHAHEHHHLRRSEDAPASPRSTHFPDSLPIPKRPRATSSASQHLPLPSTAPGARPSAPSTPLIQENGVPLNINQEEKKSISFDGMRDKKGSIAHSGAWTMDESDLKPARMPPKYSVFDFFPFSLLVKMLTKKGKNVQGRKAARVRATMTGDMKARNMARDVNSRLDCNVPLALSLYLSSYIAALQSRKATVDAPTITVLYAALNQLVDALTALERILTTPLPFSYSIHLWLVTVIYCMALPFQLWSTLGWVTVPATILASFAFFGFIVAGEEIESYDKNDLNMDFFVQNIICKELSAITSIPTPDPAVWAFHPDNDKLFSHTLGRDAGRTTPDEWVSRGAERMREVLASY